MRNGLLVLAVALTALLAGCESSEQRAEKHFQSALALLAEGDTDRAIVEFRNVFKLNAEHLKARLAFAGLMEAQGSTGVAYREFLLAAEQAPENLGARRSLARLAAEQGRWDDAAPHLEAALALAPDDPELKALKAGQAYAAAVQSRDNSARRAAAREIAAYVTELPEFLLLRVIVIDNALREQNFQAALNEIDMALALAPQARALYQQRLAVLSQLGDHDAVEAGLIDLVERFPEEPENQLKLVRWYVSRGQAEQAEAFLRDAARQQGDDADRKLALISFLRQIRGADAALEELNAIIAQNDDTRVFRAMRAGFLFDSGQTDQALAEMEALLDGAPPSDEIRNFQVTLARMYQGVGDAVAARALAETVLSQDAGHVEALKLKARWLIEDDDLSAAIALLRTALDQSPEDAGIMTLMAQAYERGGDRELMSEMLALAVEASNKAPRESIRYAGVLAQGKKYLPAEAVLLDSLRLNRDNVDILVPLGRLYVKMGDWPRTETVANSLERLDNAVAQAAALNLRAAVLQAQDKTADTLDYLQALVERGEGGLGAQIAILRSHLSNGDSDAARAYAAQMLAEDPQSYDRRFVQGTVFAALNEPARAEQIYTALLDEDPAREKVWSALYRLHKTAGRSDAARATLGRALEVLPDSETLLWTQAGDLEAEGDISGAIGIYERMYARNSSNAIIANNLASLLASYRGDDPESLDRAFVVARRLRGTGFPPFQDTYGWLVHLRGDSAEALSYMEPAAAAIPADPLVQFHLAEIYAALDRPADALEYYRKVLDLVGELDMRAFVQTARAQAVQLANSTEPRAN